MVRMVTETDIELSDGRVLHAYDTGSADGHDLTVMWHHGTPNIGSPPAPLFPASERLGIRWVSYDRPSYGRSTPQPGRTVGSAAEHAEAVADGLGIGRFAVMGHSGGGPHALACGALLADRVLSVVSGSGLAPFGAEGLDFFAGMAVGGKASLLAATQGRAAKAAYEAAPNDSDIGFISADYRALGGDWSWFGPIVSAAISAGPDGLIDDDLAYVAPWGFDPALVTAPLLLIHGERDGMVPCSHGKWLAGHCPTASLRLYPDDGHISVLNHAESALEWLAEHARQ